jgi:hypothetical protein
MSSSVASLGAAVKHQLSLGGEGKQQRVPPPAQQPAGHVQRTGAGNAKDPLHATSTSGQDASSPAAGDAHTSNAGKQQPTRAAAAGIEAAGTVRNAHVVRQQLQQKFEGEVTEQQHVQYHERGRGRGRRARRRQREPAVGPAPMSLEEWQAAQRSSVSGAEVRPTMPLVCRNSWRKACTSCQSVTQVTIECVFLSDAGFTRAATT